MDESKKVTGKVSAEELKKKYAERKNKLLTESKQVIVEKVENIIVDDSNSPSIEIKNEDVKIESKVIEENEKKQKDKVESEEPLGSDKLIACINNLESNIKDNKEVSQNKLKQMYLEKYEKNRNSNNDNTKPIQNENKENSNAEQIHKENEFNVISHNEILNQKESKDVIIVKNEVKKVSPINEKILQNLINLSYKSDYKNLFSEIEKIIFNHNEFNNYSEFISIFKPLLQTIKLNNCSTFIEIPNLSKLVKFDYFYNLLSEHNLIFNNNYEYLRLYKNPVWNTYSTLNLITLAYIEKCIILQINPSFSNLFSEKLDLAEISNNFYKKVNFEKLRNLRSFIYKVFNTNFENDSNVISNNHNHLNEFYNNFLDEELIETVTDLFRYSLFNFILNFKENDDTGYMWRCIKALIDPDNEEDEDILNFICKYFKMNEIIEKRVSNETPSDDKIKRNVKFNYKSKKKLETPTPGDEDEINIESNPFNVKIIKSKCVISFFNLITNNYGHGDLLDNNKKEKLDRNLPVNIYVPFYFNSDEDVRFISYNSKSEYQIEKSDGEVDSEIIRNLGNCVSKWIKKFHSFLNNKSKDDKLGISVEKINLNEICDKCFRSTENIIFNSVNNNKICQKCLNRFSNHKINK